jgi:hypothetical protein
MQDKEMADDYDLQIAAVSARRKLLSRPSQMSLLSSAAASGSSQRQQEQTRLDPVAEPDHWSLVSCPVLSRAPPPLHLKEGILATRTRTPDMNAAERKQRARRRKVSYLVRTQLAIARKRGTGKKRGSIRQEELALYRPSPRLGPTDGDDSADELHGLLRRDSPTGGTDVMVSERRCALSLSPRPRPRSPALARLAQR